MFFYLSLTLILLVLFSTSALLFESWQTSRRYKHLPWIGLAPRSWWMLNYVRIRNWFRLKQEMNSAIEKYWSKGQACYYPMLQGDFLILPPNDFEWMLDQPDDTLDIHAQLSEVTQATHTLLSQYALDNPTHTKTISRDLTRRLGDLTPDVADELALAIDNEWGCDAADWKEINPFATLLKVTARASNRVFVGPEVCRLPGFVDNNISIVNTVMPLAWILAALPVNLRSTVAPLISYKNRSHRQRMKDYLRPEIEARLKEAREDPAKRSINKHNDFIQWTINNAFKSDLPRETEVDIISERVGLANFAAIHTSTISITNAIFDLVSQPSTQNNIETLRKEANTILAMNNGTWTKTAISSLTKIDSALKESARLGQLSAFSFARRVAAPNGITAPVSGTYLPKGTQVAVPMYMIHRNPDIYPDPLTYKPLRFAEQRSQTNNHSTDNAESKSLDVDATAGTSTSTSTATSTLKASALSWTSTSPHFQTFSHGRHACPGRFFAANELKLLMAYIVQHYDFEILETRPENLWLGNSIVCPVDKKIRVRRREKV